MAQEKTAREQWEAVNEAALKVSRQFRRLHGDDGWDPENVEFWESGGDEILVPGTDTYGDPESNYVPWEYVEAHLKGEDWQTACRAEIKAEREEAEALRLARAAIDKEERDQRREDRDRSEYERLQEKYGSGS